MYFGDTLGGGDAIALTEVDSFFASKGTGRDGTTAFYLHSITVSQRSILTLLVLFLAAAFCATEKANLLVYKRLLSRDLVSSKESYVNVQIFNVGGRYIVYFFDYLQALLLKLN